MATSGDILSTTNEHFIPVFERQKSLPARNTADIQVAALQRTFAMICEDHYPSQEHWYLDHIYPSTALRDMLNSANKAIAVARGKKEKSAQDYIEKISYCKGPFPAIPQAVGAVSIDISHGRRYIGIITPTIIDGTKPIRDIIAVMFSSGIQSVDDRFIDVQNAIEEKEQVTILNITFAEVPRGDRKNSPRSLFMSQGRVRKTNAKLDIADDGDKGSL